MERPLLSQLTMLHVRSWLDSSPFRLGPRWCGPLVGAALLAGCGEPDECPSSACPSCSCDAELVEAIVDDLTDDSEPSCGSLAQGACQRSAHCTLEASCAAASFCSSNNCSDACDVVTRCVPYR